MHPAGTPNPVQIQSWLGVYPSCSHNPPTQGSEGPSVENRDIISVGNRDEENIKYLCFVHVYISEVIILTN